MDRLVSVLAGTVGAEPEVVRRALHDMAAERAQRRVASEVLAPYMNRAYWNYRREGDRLAAAILAARLR